MSDNEQSLALLASMLRIRRFEEQCSQLYAAGHIRGSMHLCNGQEAVSVGACAALAPEDGITMTYRGHGQALAKGLDPTAGFAELLGRATGCCGGYGGSMHFTDLTKGIYGGNALVAAGIPIAVGLALAAQQQRTGRVFLTFFGDGATNQGVWHEAFVLAAMWQAPIVFICENNLWAEMTPYADTIRVADLAERAAAYGLPGVVVDGMDVEAMRAATAAAVATARAGGGPTLIEAKTYRFVGHMYGDAQKYKPAEQVATWQARDPLLTYRQRLAARGIPPADLDALELTVAQEIRAAAEAALAAPWPDPAELPRVMEVYA
ncbi:MAG: thiamine pyrophosphate-dependent dehydrogenase E1 component subunit alpha [Ktedonobacterales bacterium]|nr:thiamine pyrophosphate-dependent dehydrogenase E1 component subunit alpha [Ktedonobacterales bacterium]